MTTGLEEPVTISLPRGILLVLFEYLARSYDTWRKSAEARTDNSFVLLPPEAGERFALWHFEGAIERSLPEIFASDYQALVSEWKRHLVSKNAS
jgi:hypothetical protein